ncbi:uncharacterized protein LOC120456919 isoform X2 [Drosophila santomea]|uniref:uncharacterized protein LOC120456919 isoform X2 n=1 Tax=Drosophila santomea TaxID=129105 RepID=UPI0019546346|nr:uncharacterized protein LOC120456919 isoform X2 [Drosophila santomea]
MYIAESGSESQASQLQVSSKRSRKEPSPADFQFLITGGYRPETNDLVKYTVMVQMGKPKKFFGDNHHCSGVIFSQRAILTAAHCMYYKRQKLKPKQLMVVAGTPKRLVKGVTTQIMESEVLLPHPKHNKDAHKYDLGLILMKKDLSLGAAVATISLYNKAPVAGVKCSIVGWGTIFQVSIVCGVTSDTLRPYPIPSLSHPLRSMAHCRMRPSTPMWRYCRTTSARSCRNGPTWACSAPTTRTTPMWTAARATRAGRSSVTTWSLASCPLAWVAASPIRLGSTPMSTTSGIGSPRTPAPWAHDMRGRCCCCCSWCCSVSRLVQLVNLPASQPASLQNLRACIRLTKID